MAIPELKRLAAGDDPFFLFLRHMDPHSPYLPPTPFMRAFYDGNEFDLGGKETIALCRCGHSENRPFCDGAHKSCGFESSEPAK